MIEKHQLFQIFQYYKNIRKLNFQMNWIFLTQVEMNNYINMELIKLNISKII